VASNNLLGAQMNKSRLNLQVQECKIQASILLKSLRSENSDMQLRAIKRFQCLAEFAKFSHVVMLAAPIKLKHALLVIAIENGFQSWVQLKTEVPFIRGGFLNKWFANYAEAKQQLRAENGFLLPYKKQFFICDASYIAQLGLDPLAPDWELIGYDWANPNDKAAWQRLYKQWMHIQENRHD
jgi:hypothetical protein